VTLENAIWQWAPTTSSPLVQYNRNAVKLINTSEVIKLAGQPKQSDDPFLGSLPGGVYDNLSFMVVETEEKTPHFFGYISGYGSSASASSLRIEDHDLQTLFESGSFNSPEKLFE